MSTAGRLMLGVPGGTGSSLIWLSSMDDSEFSCIMQCLLHGGKDMKIAVHDFWNRPFYHGVLRFSLVVDKADTMAVIKPNGEDYWPAAALRLRHMFGRR